MVTYTRYIPTNQKISNNDDFLGAACSKEGAVGSSPLPHQKYSVFFRFILANLALPNTQGVL